MSFRAVVSFVLLLEIRSNFDITPKYFYEVDIDNCQSRSYIWNI